MQVENLDLGQLVVFGTPAEEGGGGKVIMINKGCFDQVDFCIMAHPYVEDIIYHPEVALEQLQITYHGILVIFIYIFIHICFLVCCVALVLLHFAIIYFDALIKISFHRP